MTHPLAGRRMLVIEDEAMVAMLVEDFLTDLGCQVVEVAGTLNQGLEAAEKHMAALDGAILDINLGGEMVFPIADVLQAQGVKFIFSTGYGSPAIEDRYSHYPVISKPFSLESLAEMLTKALKV